MHTLFWLKNLKGEETSRLEDNIKMDVGERRWEGVNRCIWFRIGTSGGLFEHGNKPASSRRWAFS
jgi:hypothetical protein